MMPLCILALHLTAERLRERLHYDPATGFFTWRSRGKIGSHIIVGARAGCVAEGGYRQINIDGRAYHENRLAWFYMTDGWPKNQVDHINLDTGDNRWANLRAATQSQNRANTRVQINNTSGRKGVFWHKKAHKWRAMIRVDKKLRSLGLFFTPEDAYVAYLAAAKGHFGDFARVSWDETDWRK